MVKDTLDSSSGSQVYSAVIDTVRRISGQEPVIFQRDGRVIATSSAGFGMVNYGLPTDFRDWEGRQDWEKDKPEPEARKYSRPVTLEVASPGRSSTLQGSDSELRYFQPLIINPDGGGITLAEIGNVTKAYSELPADGQVRMVDHSSWYHSHKYGYAADGTSVAPTVGRVMPIDKFLELLGNTEDSIFANIEEQFGRLKGVDGRSPESIRVYGDYCNFGSVHLPDAFVLTPNVFVSFLRNGTPNMREKSNNWSRNTELGTFPYVNFDLPDSFKTDPFGTAVTINSQRISARDAKSYRAEQGRILEETAKELEAVEATVKGIEPIIARLNAFHNELFSSNIDFSKRLRERVEA